MLAPQFSAHERSARPINAPTIMPMISSNAMAHMGILREGSPPLHYIPIRKTLKDGELHRAIVALQREYMCPPRRSSPRSPVIWKR